MDLALWSFLLGSPEISVPYPWERRFDVQAEILLYENRLDGTIVVDLRRKVNLGGGLFHISDLWDQITLRSNPKHHSSILLENQQNEAPPFLIHATCCGPFVYLLTPEAVQKCPLCQCDIIPIN